ncbi:MAG: hypothetical protein JWO73_558 [Candidatus Taylorbacteria bacterium]|nr:hypothetical protein [Candidatus Taylorbacteria bacterium]
MTSVSEKPKAIDEKAEHAIAQAPEVLGIDEADLNKLAEEASAEIAAVQGDIIASADQRVETAPASVGLSQEKAAAIYSSGGFAERIEGIKAKISDFAESANVKIDLMRLKLQGIENPERVLAVARYLEESAVETESHHRNIKKSNAAGIEKQSEKFRKQGFEVKAFESSDKDTMNIYATKETPYSFNAGKSKYLAKDIEKMAAKNDPIKLLEALRDAGYQIDITKGGTFKDYYGLRDLAKNADVLPLLEKLKSFGGASVAHDFGKRGEEAMRDLSKLATKDAAEHLLTPEAEKNIERVSSLLGKPIDLNMLESWIRLSKDPALMEILSLSKPAERDEPYAESSMMHRLEIIKEAGIGNEYAALLKDGFSEKSIGKLYGHHTEKTAKDLRSAAEAFEADPELKKLALGMEKVFAADAYDEQDILNKETIEKLQELAREIPAASAAFSNLADLGLRGGSWHMDLAHLLDRNNPENVFACKEILEVIAEPDFKDFFASCEKSGYKFTLADFFNEYPKSNRLIESYRYEPFRSAIESESGQALAEHLGIFKVPMNQWNIWILGSLSKIPDSLPTLVKLEEKYSYAYDPNSNENNNASYNLTMLLNDHQELLSKLFEPQKVETMRLLNAEFGIALSLVGAQEFSDIAEDADFIAALNNPESVAFAKAVLKDENKDINTIKALFSCNPAFRPIIEKMVKEFDYAPRGTYDMSYEYDEEKDREVGKRQLVLADAAKFQELLDNPILLEIQQHLESVGMRKNPLTCTKELKVISENNLLPMLEQCQSSPKTQEFLWNNLEAAISISRLSPEKVSTYLEIFQKIGDSPSQEIQRLKDSLLSQLSESEHPIEDYQKIESIFIKNNIPTVGKIYGVFETLHGPEVLERTIKSMENVSPVLKEASTRKRYYTLYQDLLKVHIESGNRSLKEYAEIFQSGGQLIERFESAGLESLSPREQEQLRYFVGKLETLQSKSALDSADDAFAVANAADVEQRIAHVKEGLKVAEGQTVLERVSDMYLRPAGLESFVELLDRMRNSKSGADERSRQMIADARQKAGGGDVVLELSGGEFLKGVNARYIGNILQNGSVAKEFLGSDASSDSTPLDTDISLVTPENAAGGFTNSISKSLANGYGDILFALKDRGQYQLTAVGQPARAEAGKMELFQTGALGKSHYGIRTGFPSTEIDFMIVKDLASRPKDLENLFFEIAQNGYYIPVADISGKVIFTPEMYDEYRKLFAGLEKFDGSELEHHPITESELSYEKVTSIAEALPEENDRVERATQTIRSEVERVLGSMGVALRQEFDTGILGAELLDTGSTGRHTNTPGDFDFDFSLKLDAKDFPKSPQLVRAIKDVMIFDKDDSHQEAGGYYQLRVKGVTSIGGQQLDKALDIDIGFSSKSDLSAYGSHDAIRDKLKHLKGHDGPEAYEQTVANIILAKQILKEGHAYKKQEDGGFGGIGVENWILGHGGNIEEAFRSFRDAAYENGQKVPYEIFKEKYKILDPGINIKYSGHDDFIRVLKPGGYDAMLRTIENYLS